MENRLDLGTVVEAKIMGTVVEISYDMDNHKRYRVRTPEGNYTVIYDSQVATVLSPTHQGV